MRLFDSLNPKVLHVFYCHRSSTSMISFFLFVGRVMLIDIINDGFILSYSPLIKSGFKHCDASSCKLLHTENLAFRHCILFYLIKWSKYGSILISRIQERGGKIKHAHTYCIVKTLTNYNFIEYSLINKLNLGII